MATTKSSQAAIAIGITGFALGLLLPSAFKPIVGSQQSAQRDGKSTRMTSSRGERANRPWLDSSMTKDRQLAAFIDRAAHLRPHEWPSFFLAHAGSAEWSPLAAQLWADNDPAGFWNFLRESDDLVALHRWAPDLLTTWAKQDPDAAMGAVVAITDKETGDAFRRVVIDRALEENLEKGLELVRRAGDFNRFSWSSQPWIEKDPEAAARGLAKLEMKSEYGQFLTRATQAWAAVDPQKALDWMVHESPHDRLRFSIGVLDWMTSGFQAAAKVDPQAAKQAALSFEDPDERDRALAGVISSGAIPASVIPELLAGCSPYAQSQAIRDVIAHLPQNTPDDLDAAVMVLSQGPKSEKTLDTMASLASRYAKVDPSGSWEWAASLPDPALRRAANESFADALQQSPKVLADKAATLPATELSYKFFQNILGHIQEDQRRAWINQLPNDRADWAREALEQMKPSSP
ncbi:hypothetical protein JIN85_07635 [Luteolibacter pohnpeiensis]|uniref:Uncharacterized protein n=1 Tax=Luteolibacter pohnpeiensis TaxID=454153 RepID=A0A934S341_9BACT|nr:hypothetical protein [Luteolibacter pohnpeiensis]MBK1882280.1 hypothetical protein [Luteolibacter pohnpeiensis]